jgi:thioester reductase-like protein
MILVTGTTGFLGGELLVRLVEQTDREVVALIRARDDAAAQARLDAQLATLLPPGHVPDGRVRAVAADLDTPGLGMTPADRRALVRDVTAIVHSAASVSFTLPLPDAFRINVGGTREMLDLAERAPRLERFVHVSTAYVAGDRPGPYREEERDLGQTSRNTYEQTKLLAEVEVEERGLPGTTIVRPSIVVGDSRTGWTPAFNVIYWPLQAFARGLFPVVPADPEGRIDIVPVDTVADALLELVRGPVRDGAFHIVAGDGAPTASELATMAADAFDAERPDFVRPGEDPGAEMRAGALLPYFRVRNTFDDVRGRSLGVSPPPLAEYFPALMRYARDARWGKRGSPRWAAAEREMQRVA